MLFRSSHYLQLEDVSRHPWVTQYVNGVRSPLLLSIYRRQKLLSSDRLRRRINDDKTHSARSMFVVVIVVRVYFYVLA